MPLVIKETLVEHLLCAEHCTGCSTANKTGRVPPRGAAEGTHAGTKRCADELRRNAEKKGGREEGREDTEEQDPD